MLSGRGLCDELITHPEKSYQLWCVITCDLETSRSHGLRQATAPQGKKKIYTHTQSSTQVYCYRRDRINCFILNECNCKQGVC